MKAGEVYGAQAIAMLLPDDSDKVAYWKKVVAKHKDSGKALECLGKAHLYKPIICSGRTTKGERLQITAPSLTLP